MSKIKRKSPPPSVRTAPRPNAKLKSAKETQRFFYVLAIATLLLVFFLYLIFVR